MCIEQKGCEEMSNRERIEQLTEKLLLEIVKPLDIELIDVEYVKEMGYFYLRAYIDKEGGINIKDCEQVSRALDEIMEVDDPIDDAYILEVSSPGLDLPIKKDKDFERSIGKDVEFKLYKAVNGQKEFVGTLTGFDELSMDVTIDGETQTFERKAIALIRLYIEF